MMPSAQVQERHLPLIRMGSALVMSVCAVLWGGQAPADEGVAMIKSHGYPFTAISHTPPISHTLIM